ncbi:MAG: PilC/PilY family type IV pilus protein [Desulforegulaceae bacterium]|nr:PilC/PilY family type IV pilus protein [Desulforegulaceae bacterium]
MKNKIFLIGIFFLVFYSQNSISVEISDFPMISSIKKPPAHLMFIIDNSGSMNWETMMKGEAEGIFKPESGFQEYYYIFEKGNSKLKGLSKRYIKPRFFAFNKIYYNPKSDYIPWPGTKNYSSHSADLRYPKIIRFNDDSESFSDIFNHSSSIDLFGSYFDLTNGKFNIVGDDGDDGVVKKGSWSEKEYFSAYKSKFSITSDPGAYMEIYLELPSDGTYSFTGYWPFLAGDSSGEVEFEILVYKTGDNISNGVILKNQNGNAGGRLGIDGGLGNKNGNLGDFAITKDQINSNGPDIKVILRKPKNSDPDSFVKADRIDAVYQYGGTTGFTGTNDFVAKINNANYFTWDDINENNIYDQGESLYLVNFVLDESGEDIEWIDPGGKKGQGKVRREYFQVIESKGKFTKDFYLDDGMGLGSGELVPVPDLPHHAKRFKYSKENGSLVYLTAKEDLQNFANWFEFYRTRLLAAKSAMARSVYDLSDAVVGLYTINKSLSQPGLGVKTYLPSTYIADNGDIDQGKYYEERGGLSSWKDSFSSISYNGSSRQTNAVDKHSDYKAFWKINDLEESGEFKVYIRWSKHKGFFGGFFGGIYSSEMDPKTKYRVYKYKNGNIDNKILVKEMTINQNGGTKNQFKDEMLPDIWNYFCDIELSEGEKVLVELQRGTGNKYQYTSADAVKAVSKNSSSNIDNTNELLDMIYKFEAVGGTPLRRALKDVGQYFSTEESPPAKSGLGNKSPFSSEGGECLQAFAVLMTDGYWNGKNFSIGDYDNDGVSDTLADVAAKYYGDLDPDKEGKVPTNNCDSNREQHLVTYSVAFGASGNINPLDYDQCNLADKITGAPVWPGGDKNLWTNEKIDDLFHASINSRGAFYNASDPQKLFEALTSIIKDVEIRYNTGSAVSLSSHKLKSGTKVYQSFYNTGNWSGWIEAKEIEKNQEGIWEVSDKSLWNTNDYFTKGRFVPIARKIFIKDPLGEPVEFKYSEFSDSIKSKINPLISSTVAEIRQKAEEDIKKTVNYIRGEDLPGFRERNIVLGDVINSSPIKWGNTIYFGANDGMLHALDEKTGKERFAFIPSFVIENLPLLTETNYNHKYFVDHTPVIERISKFNGDICKTEDILVSGLRKGGKGYFALSLKNDKIDVDKITMSTTENLLDIFKWEFPSISDPGEEDLKDMGFSYSNPVIVKSNLKEHPFIVVFGNGYNSENGKSVLFILDAFTGECIKKISVGNQLENGMSTPAVVDKDNNFTADYVYAGDLQGNLWKFDITSKNLDDWGCFYSDGSGNGVPLFTAGYGQINQPITTKPDIAKHPLYQGYIVLFGTGKFLCKDDMDDKSTQSVYGIWDYGNKKNQYLGQIKRADYLTGKTGTSNISDVYLLNQSVAHSDKDSDVQSESQYEKVETLSDKKILWEIKKSDSSKDGYQELAPGSHFGWYFDLPDLGERIVEDPKVVSNKSVFISYVPEAAEKMCTSGGYSWFHELDISSGSRLSSPAFDINRDNKIKSNEINEDNEEKLNDVLKVEIDGEYKYLSPSRLKLSGMVFAPAIVTSEDKEAKILGTSEGKINIISEKRQRLGMYYWRIR